MFAVIIKPYNLAVSVSSGYPRCNLQEAKAKKVQQKIGQIKVDRLKPAPPFSNITADLAGPFCIKPKESRV